MPTRFRGHNARSNGADGRVGRTWDDAPVESLLVGLLLGVGSGVAPGPLLALALTTTLRRGLRAGLLVAAAPLVSDALIIALALTLIAQLPATVVTAMSIVGGLVVLAFGIETLRSVPTADPSRMRDVPSGQSRWPRLATHPLAQATALNLLNPAPWVFWLTAGGTLLVEAWSRAPIDAVALLVAFYVGIVGSKALIVGGIAAGRHRLTTRAYRRLLAGAAGLLFVVGAVLIVRGLTELL